MHSIQVRGVLQVVTIILIKFNFSSLKINTRLPIPLHQTSQKLTRVKKQKPAQNVFRVLSKDQSVHRIVVAPTRPDSHTCARTCPQRKTARQELIRVRCIPERMLRSALLSRNRLLNLSVDIASGMLFSRTNNACLL